MSCSPFCKGEVALVKHRESRWPGMVTTVLGCLWLGIFPLWQDMTYSHITRMKWIGLLALCGVTVMACLVSLLVLAFRKELRRNVYWHPAQLVALAYFAWVALSAWQGKWVETLNMEEKLVVWVGAGRYEGLMTHLCYALIFLMMSLFPPRMDVVLRAAVAALVVFCAITAVQYTGINILGLYPQGYGIYTNYEFQGTIGNIDMVSGYISLLLPLLLGSFVPREKGGWYLLAAGTLASLLAWCMEVQSGLIAMALLCGLLVLMMLRCPAFRFRGCLALAGIALALGIRGCIFLPWLDSATPREAQPVWLVFSAKAMLGLGTAGMMTLLAFILRKHPGKAAGWKPLLCIVLVCAVLAVAGVIYLPIPESAGPLWELHECLNGRPQDHFGSWRIGVWRHSLAMALESPIFGNGPDTFYYALNKRLNEQGETLGENFDNPHNEYIAILVNNGAPALVLYLLLLALTIGACWWKRQWAVAMSISCFASQGLFSFSICLVSPMFWAVMGMGAALCGKCLHIKKASAIMNEEVNNCGNEL